MAGNAESLRLRLPAEALSVVMDGGSRWLRPGVFSVMIGDEDGAGLEVELGGEAVRLPSYDWPPV